MKIHFLSILFLLFILSSTISQAQSMGISNAAITPDASSILEMRTTERGLLIPRMTTIQRGNISAPATGLMIYNTATNQYNFYNGTAWVVWGSTAYLSATSGETLTTSSTSATPIAGMTKTATEAGDYSIHFNTQITIPETVHTTGFSTAVAADDLESFYTDITAMSGVFHGLTFGSVETLLPGVYDVGGAASITGTLTLDGNNDPDALFIIRASGAFNTSADAIVVLTNGATAKNIFWMPEGAIALGANTKIYGNLFSHGAAVAGANSTITGRLLTTLGAISFGEGTLTLPTGSSIIDFGTLSSLVIFTSSGGIANTGASEYTGDIGTGAGAITGFDTATVNGIIYESGATTIVTPVNHIATFGLYKNGVLIPNSIRTRMHTSNPGDISLQGLSSFELGDTIDVRWNVDVQESDGIEISLLNRILTLIKVGN
jgi:hypothetical protein